MNEKDISRESYVANTSYGKVRGYKTKNGVISFKGIPYAEPPVKELRFSPPVPKKNWENILDAKRFGPVAPQPVEISSTEILEQSEEQCLNLNIWTPALDDKERTVMVWIHGGAFETGSGRFMGEVLAKHGDVVIASINYSLGTLGFLYVTGKRLMWVY